MAYIIYSLMAVLCVFLKFFGFISAPWLLVSALFWVPALIFAISFIWTIHNFDKKGGWL